MSISVYKKERKKYNIKQALWMYEKKFNPVIRNSYIYFMYRRGYEYLDDDDDEDDSYF
jgi:hypothetical protein